MLKNAIKKTVLNTLSSQPIEFVATRLFGIGIPIFMLHRIYPDDTPNQKHTPKYLRQCLEYLVNKKYNFVSVADIASALKNNTPLPEKSIAFTIDDGFIDQAKLAAPVFIEFNCPLTIFLITGFIDQELWPWFSKIEYMIKNSRIKLIHLKYNNLNKDYSIATELEKKHVSRQLIKYVKLQPWDNLEDIIMSISRATNVCIPLDPPDEYSPMSWDTARELEASGILFGPHTRTHPILSRQNEAQSFAEIIHSWERLKDELNNPTPIFCYPNGSPEDFSDREADFIKGTDMIAAISTIPKQLNPASDNIDSLYKLPRYSLPDNFNDFRMYCSWIEYAKEKFRMQH